jgi:hypothetical protein
VKSRNLAQRLVEAAQSFDDVVEADRQMRK